MFNMAVTLFEMKCVSDCVSNDAYITRLSSLDLWWATTGKMIVVHDYGFWCYQTAFYHYCASWSQSPQPQTHQYFRAQWLQMMSLQVQTQWHRHPSNWAHMTSLQLQMHWWVSRYNRATMLDAFWYKWHKYVWTYMTYCDSRDPNT